MSLLSDKLVSPGDGGPGIGIGTVLGLGLGVAVERWLREKVVPEMSCTAIYPFISAFCIRRLFKSAELLLEVVGYAAFYSLLFSANASIVIDVRRSAMLPVVSEPISVVSAGPERVDRCLSLIFVFWLLSSRWIYGVVRNKITTSRSPGKFVDLVDHIKGVVLSMLFPANKLVGSTYCSVADRIALVLIH